MVLVIIFVHAVSSNQKQILNFIREVSDHIEPVIAAEVSRISFRHANDNAVEDIGLVYDVQADEFIYGKFRKCGVGLAP